MALLRAPGLVFELDSSALALDIGNVPLASVSLTGHGSLADSRKKSVHVSRRRRLRGGAAAEEERGVIERSSPIQRVQAAVGAVLVVVLGRARSFHPATRRLIAGGVSGMR